MAKVLVGLTGGLAAGKSTVARMLRERGVPVLDADEVVRWLYRPGGDGTLQVRTLFGDRYLSPDGSVDRPRLAALVFADPDARRRLEQAVHPLVRDRFRQFAATRDGIVVYEACLLVETGAHETMDYLVSVEADMDTRLQRAVARGADPVEARRRLHAQSPASAREEAADFVIRNDGGEEALATQVEALLHLLATRFQTDGPDPARLLPGDRSGP